MTPVGTAPLQEGDAAQAIEVISGFIRSQLAQTGFRRLVVGLSGGVDSATTAFLAARAVQPDDLLAIRMPYRTSSADSEADARLNPKSWPGRTSLRCRLPHSAV